MSRGNIQGRESFLNQVAEKLGRPRSEHVERPEWQAQPQWDVFADENTDQLVERFKAQCDNIHTDVIETDMDGLQNAVAETIGAYQADSVIMWADDRLECAGLDDAFRSQMSALGVESAVWDTAKGEENIGVAERASVGITYSDITLAESGTVVLLAAPEKGRVVNLFPENYIAVIPRSSLVPRMTQATHRIHERVQNGEDIPSQIHFVSGPSNSADIEMSLVVGVHGPVRATYILLGDI
ncbi:LutC/YkgG family protein [Natribacillus halophilus]|uniref:Lactate utilization protein C n=1 Tax=Natribacillus halophilus TaxID=549003 RepID=A0A1G8QFM9_9BACI|nr:lactate utilization protein C [Natribacillus halophilus]SDJ03599.1 L-lactate dehydrogenase complex protein LldG [Natribacillus halophilus]